MYIKRQEETINNGTSTGARLLSIIIPLFFIFLSLTIFVFRRHAMSRIDRKLTPIYGTAWLGECGIARRDALHEATRPPTERLIIKQPSPRPNDPYPGIQEVSADERSRLAEESGAIGEMEAAQTGAGVWPFSMRRKSLLVNEEPVEMESIERERERGQEIRTAVG